MAVGIICEFNPFHNGHLYIIEKAKELFNEDIVVVLGGNFLERGNLSIIDKFDKAKIAVNHGVSLVVELPFKYATSSSDIFAMGAVKILNELKVDKIIFGTEEGSLERLEKAAEVQINNPRYEPLVREYLLSGLNYSTCMNKALMDLIGYEINNPNDILALSYIKEIKRNNYNIKAYTVKRTNDYHSKELTSNIVSGDAIRNALHNNEDINKYIPLDVLKYINRDNYNLKYFELLKYKILTDNELSKYLDVDEGIDKRIKMVIDTSYSLEELINNVKTKRYTYNKLSRMFIHILTSFTKEENKDNDLKYIRILGLNNNGKDYLNSIKKVVSIPIITNVNKYNYDILKREIDIDKIYYLITNSKEKKQAYIDIKKEEN